MSVPPLAAEGISYAVETDARRLTLLDDVSMTVSTGTVLAVTGRSGSGKTSLLSILGLMQSPTSGRVVVAGQDTSMLGDGGRADLRNRHLGFVFQGYSLMPHLTAYENVALPLTYGRRPTAPDRARVRELLAAVGLETSMTKRPHQLSGGEQQRAAIARALVREPSVVLADEPTGALDVAVGEQVLDILVSTARLRGCAVVVVTHDPVVAKAADDMLHLADGHLAVPA